MAFDHAVAFIRFNFNWQIAPEIQATGMWLRSRELTDWGAAAFDHAQSIAELARDAWKANIAPDHYAAAVTAVSAVGYTMKPDGVHVLQKGIADFSGANAWEGSAGTPLPPENSVVLSLYVIDPAQFQGSHPGRVRGRMYLPTPGNTILTSAGTVAQAVVDDWLADWQGFYDDITSAYSVGGTNFHVDPAVRSLGGKDGTTAEAIQPVLFYRMGHVVDTQRRRRNKLVEAYTDVPVT